MEMDVTTIYEILSSNHWVGRLTQRLLCYHPHCSHGNTPFLSGRQAQWCQLSSILRPDATGFSPHSSLPVSLLHRPFLPFFSPPTSLPLTTGIHRGPLLLFCQQNHHYTINFCCCLVAQLRPTLCDPTDCSLPGSCVHGILQARILQTASTAFSRGPSPPGDRTHVSCTAERFFTPEPPGKPH